MKKYHKIINLSMLALSLLTLTACSNKQNDNQTNSTVAKKQTKILPKSNFNENNSDNAKLALALMKKAQQTSYRSFYLADVTAVKVNGQKRLSQTFIKASDNNFHASVSTNGGLQMKNYCINGTQYIQAEPNSKNFYKQKAKTHKTVANTRATIKSMYSNFATPNVINHVKLNKSADKITIEIPNIKAVRSALTKNLQGTGRKISIGGVYFKLTTDKKGNPIEVHEVIKLNDYTNATRNRDKKPNFESLNIAIKDINSLKLEKELSKKPAGINIVPAPKQSSNQSSK